MINENKIKLRIIEDFYNNNYVLSFDAISFLEEIYYKKNNFDFLNDLIENIKIVFNNNFFWLNKEIVSFLLVNKLDENFLKEFNWKEFERTRVLYEKGKKTKPYNFFINYLSKKLNDSKNYQDTQINENNSNNSITKNEDKDNSQENITKKINKEEIQKLKNSETNSQDDNELKTQNFENKEIEVKKEPIENVLDEKNKTQEKKNNEEDTIIDDNNKKTKIEYNKTRQNNKQIEDNKDELQDIEESIDFNRETYDVEDESDDETNTKIIEQDSINQKTIFIEDLDLTKTKKKYPLENEVDYFSLDRDEVLKRNLHQSILDKDIDLNILEEKNSLEYNIKPIHDFKKNIKQIDISFFKNHMLKRLVSLSSFLRKRPELKNITSINALSYRKDEEKLSMIGLVSDISESLNGHIFITLEDLSGSMKVFVSKKENDLINITKSIVLDEVIGISGKFYNDLFIVQEIIFPDIPKLATKTQEKEEYAVFISDLHVGSTYFLKDYFNKFIEWINGNYGTNEEKQISKKIKYIFIAGDIVEGIGIYPGQEDSLEINSIVEQYNKAAKLLSEIREDVGVIVCPGNHDALRLAEPQPALPKKIAYDLWKLPNFFFYSSPCLINIGANEDFGGFDVLMYHGASYNYYVNNVDVLRQGGGYSKITSTMKFLLKKRHISPMHGAYPYIPDPEEDSLIIDKVPDFFVSGDIHRSDIDQYKSTTLIACSTFQDKTPFQEKLGHQPDPGIVPVVNLKTREIKIMKFNKKD